MNGNGYMVSLNGDYVRRAKQIKEDILFSQEIVCRPIEECAAKLFLGYVQEHPDENINELRCRIDSTEIEEDYYGNGGGYDHVFKIFKEREETDEEYNERILKEEDALKQSYQTALENLTNRFFELMNLDKNKKERDIQKEIFNKICPIYKNTSKDDDMFGEWKNPLKELPELDKKYYKLKVSKNVLILLNNGLMFIGYYNYINQKWASENICIDNDRVLCWHDLPKIDFKFLK